MHMMSIVTLQARIKAIQAFLNHYFQNPNNWKHRDSTEIEFKIEDNNSWDIVIYDGASIYEIWSFSDIEEYLDQNNIYV